MFKKGDFVVFGIIIAVSLVLLFTLFGSEGKYVAVTLEGETYGEYSLRTDSETLIKTQGGTNTLVIKDGEAKFMHSDCPDKTCEKTGKISHKGETIVCLPHKIIAEVRE